MANKLGELSYEIILNDSNFQSSLQKFKEETKNVTTSTSEWMKTLGGTTEKQFNALNKSYLKSQKVLSDTALATAVSSGTMIKNIDAIANPVQRQQAAWYNTQIAIMNSTKGISQAVERVSSDISTKEAPIKETTSRISTAFAHLGDKIKDHASKVGQNLEEGYSSARGKVSNGLGNLITSVNSKFKAQASEFGHSIGHNIGSSIATGLKATAVLAAGAVAGTIAFLRSSFKAYQEAEVVQAQLSAGIKSTGGAAKKSIGDLNKYAVSLQNLSGISDEAVGAAQSQLLTFTGIVGNNFDEATLAVANMATAMGNGAIPTAENMKTSALQMGKALNDPVEGLSALSRVGVKFTAQQESQIRAMVAVGNTAGAQRVMLAELNTEFGGRAAAAGDTYIGRLTKIKESFGNLQEGVGEALVNGLTPFAGKLSDFVASDQFKGYMDKLTEKVTYFFEQVIPRAIESVQKWWSENKDTIIPQMESFWKVVSSLSASILTFFANIRDNKAELIAFSIAIAAVMIALNPLGTLLGVIMGIVSYWIIKWPIMKEGLVELGSVGARAFSVLNNPVAALTESVKLLFGWLDKVFNLNAGEKLAGLKDKVSNFAKSLPNPFASIPGRASGGPVSGRSPYIVGEKGPELFVPGSNGSIIPNHKLSDGSGSMGSVTINMSGAYMLSTADDKRRFAQELQTVLSQASSLNYAS